MEPPDVIVIGANGVNGKVPTVNDLMNDPQWASIAAVQNHRVYQIRPAFICGSSTAPRRFYSCKWAAGTLYPAQFTGIGINRAVTDFYKTHCHYDLTSDDVNAILTAQAQPPA